MVKQEVFEVDAAADYHMEDITGQVASAVQTCGMKDGIVVVFVPGATGAITTIEYEDGLEHDFREMLDRLIPEAAEYQHNLRWHDGNGFSHVRASLIGPSLSVPVTDGRLTLGTWQQIVFLNFDNKRRTRKIIVQMVGE